MIDTAFPTRPASTGHRRRRPPQIDSLTMHCVRRAVARPLLLLAALLGAVSAAWSLSTATHGLLVTGLVAGLVVVAWVADRGARTAAGAVQAAAEERQAALLTTLTGAAAAVEKSVTWSADELCRGARPPLPDMPTPQPASPNGAVDTALSALQVHAVAALIRVHDESQSVVLLEVLRRLAMREHALVSKALTALSRLEMLTDDPDLLAKIFEIDHLVTRMRRQVESTAVLGGQSLRSVRRPVPVTTTLRGAVSEVVQYPRVVVAAGSVGAQLGLPGHVGPDLSHLVAELIENACECSDPATKVWVRAQRVPNGLAVEVEDRAVPMRAEARAQMNRLLRSPDEVDVTGQVRAGQLGLLVAAKIAQSHGLSVVLQENVTGGTTALVVIPARLLVALAPIDGAGGSHPEIHTAARPPLQPSSAMANPSTAQAGLPAVAESPLDGEAERSAPAPALPRRTRQPGALRLQREREQAPAMAARPGLAGAFRNGIESGGSTSTTSDTTGQPQH
ncbi:sensor histidine kinase [Streptomyces anulatus]|uniref:histidine kinase n=1 Tax=Streptomyces anulatus TaxID=1892 RepID=A0A6G3T1Q5_STRAQ|nr:ATP-binding protein [Streptomyces anulatus]NEB88912.1 sensor histidine kinase [Streptomyces anulatus]